MNIDKIYNPQGIEKKWYKHWIDKGYFTPKREENKKPYTILIPPPNVTNILHMGHVLNNTLQDVMIRYRRMTGIPVLWLPGVDHAGIATQNMVEKDLAKEGKTRHDIGREEMVRRIWKWKEEKGGRIIEQLKQLGASCDWSRERFTMDEGLTAAVKEVFIRLYKKGLIYKGKRIINWCPRCVTALSNDEVEYEDAAGKLWDIRYPLQDGSGYITVTTTRPETMLGDTAIAVHPRDKRFLHLVGKEVILPFVNRSIPIIADEYVDMDFGTGCVKITPAHDPNDYEIGLRHNLQQVVVMDEHGIMNVNAGQEFAGLDRLAAREKIVTRLHELNLLGRIKDHKHSVGHCYRCETVVEPYLSDQWFVDMKPLAQRAIKVVKEGKIKFQPQRWIKVYLHWMDNIRDWCISRQIWWGHRIPVYYCNDCHEIMVEKTQPVQCSKCGRNNIRQDEDVLDTWFSSWLWPFSTLGWPQETADLAYFLPTNLLVTGPDIIYLWVARMIMATLEFRNKIPFDTVLLHGMVRDEIGRKMSKSLGNSPDPLDIIENVGADALRFSIIFASPKGQDSYYSNSILETGRNFANKIWNAFRFVMMNIEKIPGLPAFSDLKMELVDKWIYSRLNRTVRKTKSQYENLRFNDAANSLLEFIWKDFCSWYLELSKERIYATAPMQDQLTVKYILLDVLQNSMRMLQPIMPFIAEEVWQKIREFFPMKEEAIVIAAFPKIKTSLLDHSSEQIMDYIRDTITAIRSLRKQVNIPPGQNIDVVIKVSDNEDLEQLNLYHSYFRKLARVENMRAGIDIRKPEHCIATVVKNSEIYLPLSGLVDIDAERNKLCKQQDKLKKELDIVLSKLNDRRFLDNAPESIIEKEKRKHEEIRTKLDKIDQLIQEMN